MSRIGMEAEMPTDAEEQDLDGDLDTDEDLDADGEDGASQDAERPSDGWGPQGEPFFGRGNSGFGIVLAVVGFIDLMATAVWVVVRMGDSELFEYSAVQVTQLYTQGVFWVLVAIGVMAAGRLFVASTRTRDE